LKIATLTTRHITVTDANTYLTLDAQPVLHGCTNPAHLRLGGAAQNRAEWVHRHRDPTGPLADLRGAAGRTRAIATAVRAGLAAEGTQREIEERIRAAETEGLPLTFW
jgi:hypothetical protein